MSDEKKTLPYELKRPFDECVARARPDGEPVYFGSRIIDKEGESYRRHLRDARTVVEFLQAEGYPAEVVEGVDTTDLPEGCGLDEVYGIAVVTRPKPQTPEARAARIAAAVPQAAKALHSKCVEAAFRAGQDKRKERKIEVFADASAEADPDSERYATTLAAAEAVAERIRAEEKASAMVVESEGRVRLDISF